MESHPRDQIIGDINKRVTWINLGNICNHQAFSLQFEPKNINEALSDESWVMVMQEQVNQFEIKKQFLDHYAKTKLSHYHKHYVGFYNQIGWTWSMSCPKI